MTLTLRPRRDEIGRKDGQSAYEAYTELMPLGDEMM